MKNIILILMSVSVLSFAAPAMAAHGGEVVHIKTLGLVCDFCAQAVEKTFMKTGFVQSIKVNLDDALITIVMKAGTVFDDDTIRKTMTDAGYNVESIHHAPEAAHE